MSLKIICNKKNWLNKKFPTAKRINLLKKHYNWSNFYANFSNLFTVTKKKQKNVRKDYAFSAPRQFSGCRRKVKEKKMNSMNVKLLLILFVFFLCLVYFKPFIWIKVTYGYKIEIFSCVFLRYKLKIFLCNLSFMRLKKLPEKAEFGIESSDMLKRK